MAISTQLKRYAGRRITRRLMRSMPWIGGVIALATVGSAIRRKGLLRGTVDTALDFTPFVGSVKNLAEAVRGRDFIQPGGESVLHQQRCAPHSRDAV